MQLYLLVQLVISKNIMSSIDNLIEKEFRIPYEIYENEENMKEIVELYLTIKFHIFSLEMN